MPTPTPPASVRNHNPGNLMHSRIKWNGEVGADSAGRVIFKSDVDGARAFGLDLLSDWERGAQSVREIISGFAPQDDGKTAQLKGNNVDAYTKRVSEILRVGPDDTLDLTNLGTLAGLMRAMAVVEAGYEAFPLAVLQQGAQLALERRPYLKPLAKSKAVQAGAGLTIGGVTTGVGAAIAVADQGMTVLDRLTTFVGQHQLASLVIVGVVVAAIGVTLLATVLRNRRDALA